MDNNETFFSLSFVSKRIQVCFAGIQIGLHPFLRRGAARLWVPLSAHLWQEDLASKTFSQTLKRYDSWTRVAQRLEKQVGRRFPQRDGMGKLAPSSCENVSLPHSAPVSHAG
jgi:hypothetical protein